MVIRTGFGYDVHRLEENHEFWLGGILIPHSKGAVGHSDADTLIHALCDALLGAAGLRDIGFHFPDTDPRYKGIDSKILLKNVHEIVSQQGYSIGNIDITVILQKPKLSGHIPEMISVISAILNINTGQLAIKAKTSEGLGLAGREEGVIAYATVLIHKE
ncbi:MAG: 2-C-methyl-D-erythritol 2,4-cyclodiphosphate synthase [Bacteroidales bacterium]